MPNGHFLCFILLTSSVKVFSIHAGSLTSTLLVCPLSMGRSIFSPRRQSKKEKRIVTTPSNAQIPEVQREKGELLEVTSKTSSTIYGVNLTEKEMLIFGFLNFYSIYFYVIVNLLFSNRFNKKLGNIPPVVKLEITGHPK